MLENILLEDVLIYTALAIAMASFMQGNIMRLRVMGVVASIIFGIQAYLIEQPHLVVANVCFMCIHLYWIYKYKKVVDKVAKK